MATVYPAFEVGDYVMVAYGRPAARKKIHRIVKKEVLQPIVTNTGTSKGTWYIIPQGAMGNVPFHAAWLNYAGANALAEFARAELTGKDRAEALRQAVRTRLLG